MDIRFGDHSSFHRAAAGMVGGSAVLGLALAPVTPMAPLVAGALGIGLGAALGYGKPVWRVALTGAALVPLFVLTPSWTSLSIVAALLGITVAAFGPRGIRGALAVMLGASATLLAMWSAVRVGQAQETQAWSPWARELASATAMGMVGVFSVLPRHLRVSLDPVTAAMRRLPMNELDAEVRELCTRSLAIWNTAKDKLADHDPGKNLVRDGVLKTFEVAARSADIKAQGASDGELARRMADLDARIAAATDAEVKTQYQSARTALEDQKRYRESIEQNRQRMIARMHNHVAALEKFQLAAGGLAAVRAAGAAAVKQLEDLSADVAASGEALAELELEGSSVSTPAAVEPTDTVAEPAPSTVA